MTGMLSAGIFSCRLAPSVNVYSTCSRPVDWHLQLRGDTGRGLSYSSSDWI